MGVKMTEEIDWKDMYKEEKLRDLRAGRNLAGAIFITGLIGIYWLIFREFSLFTLIFVIILTVSGFFKFFYERKEIKQMESL